MPTDCYPEDLTITIDDFRCIDLQAIAKEHDKHGLKSIFTVLADSAKAAMERKELAQGKVLWLLSDACSMMLNPKRKNEPFSPFMIMGGKRSAMLDDFTSDDLAFFSEVVESIEDYRIQARVADILWTANKPKKIDHVIIAIDNYMKYSLDSKSFLRDGSELWLRAIILAKSIGKTGIDRLIKIRDLLYEELMVAKQEDSYYALKLSELLREIGFDHEKSNEVASHLEEIAREYFNKKNWSSAKNFFEEAIEWYRSINNAKVIQLRHDIAQTWIEEAEARMTDNNYIAAGIFFDNAIKAYRCIPREYRHVYDIETKLHKTHLRMNEANQLSIGDMHRFETPTVDISKSIESAIKYMKDKSYPDVLLYFAYVVAPEKYSRVSKSAEETMSASPLRFLASSVSLTSDGRVASRSPGLDPMDTSSSAREESLFSEMMMHFSIGVGLSVQSRILPALQQLLQEHRITEEMIMELCKSSAIIPVDREIFWAKGLYFGFEGDYLTAIHLLSPQLEHFVRMALKDNGVKTSTIDAQGIETENGLSKLLDKPEAKEIFDEDILFEMKALMTSPHGPNLRNEIAHGLITAEEGLSQYAKYLWWRMLRLMLDAVFIERKEKKEE